MREPVRSYYYKYTGDLPGESGTIHAKDYDDFCSQLKARQQGAKQHLLEAGSISYTEFNEVPDPPSERGIRVIEVRETGLVRHTPLVVKWELTH